MRNELVLLMGTACLTVFSGALRAQMPSIGINPMRLEVEVAFRPEAAPEQGDDHPDVRLWDLERAGETEICRGVCGDLRARP